MAKYPLVLLDNDGTLMDFKQAQAHALFTMLEQFGLETGPEVLSAYDAINNSVWEEFERGEITKPQLQDKRFVLLAEHLGKKDLDPKEMNLAYTAALGMCTFEEPGAVDLLKALYGKCTLAVITNGIERVQNSRYNRSFLKDYIPYLFVSEAMGAQKPSKDYFDKVFDILKDFDRSDAIILGDSLTADMAGGKNAGVATCWYNPKGLKNNTDVVPTYEIKELSEFLPIVFGE
ncbi:MAG: noncanonical pyrimidine nucleotidase, YjjG family [Clostridiales bacterium]|nr:noncanonical pyrimidine nucleotidase, YjjG family [Clostridiales bacterium]